jgi:peptidoglycan hydrolase-like protein with peptidoglycan-binding domain
MMLLSSVRTDATTPSCTAPASDPQEAADLALLSVGSEGSQVRDLQRELNAHGAALAEDGIFGPQTENAVRRLQQRLGVGVDGIVGPETRHAMAADELSRSFSSLDGEARATPLAASTISAQRLLDESRCRSRSSKYAGILERNPLYRRLDDDSKGRVLNSVQNRDFVSNQALGALLSTPEFQSMSKEERRKTLDLFEATNVGGRMNLATLAMRRQLRTVDGGGTPMLDSLHRMLTQTQPGIADRSLALSIVLRGAVDPSYMSQSALGAEAAISPAAFAYTMADAAARGYQFSRVP